MAIRLQLRRDAAANWTSVNPILALGEPGVETDTLKVKVGDGVTAWNSLDYSISNDFDDLLNTPSTLAGYGIVDALALANLSVTDTGGDGSLSYNDSTGVFTYTGPSASEVRAHFSAGTGITITSGEIATTITQYADSDVDAHLSGGTGVTYTAGAISIGQAVGTGDSVEFAKVTTSTIDSADSSPITVETDVTMLAGLTVGNHILPSSNENIDLGSATNRFRDLYLSGNTLNLGGTTISRHTDGSLAVKAHDTGAPMPIRAKELVVGEGANTIVIRRTVDGLVEFDSQDADGVSGGLIEGKFSNLRTTGNVQIDGDLVVSGDTTTLTATNLAVSDNMLYLNNAIVTTITNVVGNGTIVVYTTSVEHGYTQGMTVSISGVDPSAYNLSEQTITAVTTDTFTIENAATGAYVSGGTARARTNANPDLGFAAGYYDGGYGHAGFFRDATDGVFKVFEGYTPEPDASAFIDIADPSFSIADFQAGTGYFTDISLGGTAVTATAAELNYTDGVTSNIQTQLDAKANLSGANFTGNVDVTGEITASGDISTTGGDVDITGAQPRVNLKETDTTDLDVTLRLNAGDLIIETRSDAGTALGDRIRAASNGDISFYEDTGTTAKFFWDASAERLQIGGNAQTGGRLYLESGTATSFIRMHCTTGTGGVHTIQASGANGLLLDINADQTLALNTNGSERMRIDSSGNLLVGTTSSNGRKLRIYGSGDLVELVSTNSGLGGAQIDLKHESASPADGDIVGLINFVGYDSGNNSTQYASIQGVASSVSSETGELRFGTRTNSSTYNSSAMVITSSGNVGIGTNNPLTALHVQKSVSGDFISTFQNTNSSTPYGVWVKDAATPANGYPLLQVTDSAGTGTYFRVDSGTGNIITNGVTEIRNRTETGYASNLAETVSKATLKIKTHSTDSTLTTFGGISGGDAYIQRSNGPGTSSYNLRLNPYGGRVLMPNQPAFHLTGLTSDLNAVSGAGTITNWSTVNLNRGNHWNGTNWTVPIAGTYLIQFDPMFKHDGAGDISFQIQVNGSSVAYNNPHTRDNAGNAPPWHNAPVSWIGELNASDAVSFSWGASGGTSSTYIYASGLYTRAFGYLLG